MHRYLLKWGVALQYSVFLVEVGAPGLTQMEAGLSRIVAAEDDVRIYRVPDRGGFWTGRSARPDGVLLTGGAMGRMLELLDTGDPQKRRS